MKHRQTAVIATISVFAACSGGSGTGATSDPRLLSLNLPFVYPPALYTAGVEGDVALRLFIDSLGLVVQESTTVAEPSGHPEFDAAAVAGAPYLEFEPARRDGSRIGKTVVLPVKFRHPPDTARRDTLRR